MADAVASVFAKLRSEIADMVYLYDNDFLEMSQCIKGLSDDRPKTGQVQGG